MIQARETRVTQWGPSLGVRLPKEIADSVGIKNKSMVRVELKYGAIQVMPVKEQRYHIPLSERMEKAIKDDAWDETPYGLTKEDMEWLNMPLVGEEIAW